MLRGDLLVSMKGGGLLGIGAVLMVSRMAFIASSASILACTALQRARIGVLPWELEGLLQHAGGHCRAVQLGMLRIASHSRNILDPQTALIACAPSSVAWPLLRIGSGIPGVHLHHPLSIQRHGFCLGTSAGLNLFGQKGRFVGSDLALGSTPWPERDDR